MDQLLGQLSSLQFVPSEPETEGLVFLAGWSVTYNRGSDSWIWNSEDSIPKPAHFKEETGSYRVKHDYVSIYTSF